MRLSLSTPSVRERTADLIDRETLQYYAVCDRISERIVHSPAPTDVSIMRCIVAV
jgi:4-hydroxy-3-methylbut-2-en-1-yl diphosphate synthase IspG/GcpE